MSQPQRRAGSDPESDFAVEPTPEECVHVTALNIRNAINLAVIGTACWYAFWFLIPNEISAWAGVLIFAAALAAAFWFSRTMLQRRVEEEMRRRTELVKMVKRRQAQTKSTT
jgi:hypothetical protein